MKFKDGANIFRILAPVVMGWEDWKVEPDGTKKPVRVKYEGEASKPKPLGKQAVKHLWAFPVFDYTDKAIKVLEITQVSLINGIYTCLMDEDFGDPTGYDIKVNRTGENLETRYELLAKPPKELDPEVRKLWEETYVDCNALFTNDDPFEQKGAEAVPAGGEPDLIPEVSFDEMGLGQ